MISALYVPFSFTSMNDAALCSWHRLCTHVARTKTATDRSIAATGVNYKMIHSVISGCSGVLDAVVITNLNSNSQTFFHHSSYIISTPCPILKSFFSIANIVLCSQVQRLFVATSRSFHSYRISKTITGGGNFHN